MTQRDQNPPEDKPSINTWIEAENCDAFDFNRLMQRLHDLAAKHRFRAQNLGDIANEPLLLLTPTDLKEGPRALVAAGFHGDEPAGCWGIIRFLDRGASSNLSFLPLVNPSGFRQRKRKNIWGEDPNRGFFYNHPTIDRGTNEPPPSREGKILLRNLDLLLSLSRNGFLSLHEDVEYSKCYVYSFENSKTPGRFSQTLRTETAKFFEFFPDGPLEGGFVHDGIIFDYRDGSFEDLLFRSGIPNTASTESPGLLDINLRVEANASLISALARFVLTQSA